MPFFLTPWFWEFFFYNPHLPHFFEAAVWSNVAAVAPCGLVLGLYLRSKHLAVLEAHEALKAAHVEHAEKLDRLLNKLDPSTDGGIGELRELLNPNTPDGLGVINTKLDSLKPTPEEGTK